MKELNYYYYCVLDLIISMESGIPHQFKRDGIAGDNVRQGCCVY